MNNNLILTGTKDVGPVKMTFYKTDEINTLEDIKNYINQLANGSGIVGTIWLSLVSDHSLDPNQTYKEFDILEMLYAEISKQGISNISSIDFKTGEDNQVHFSVASSAITVTKPPTYQK